MAGSYVFTSGGATDVIGYFYETYFDPYNPTTNLITDDDDSAGSLQFRISVILQAGRDYFLVVSTHRPSAVGSFSIFATGPSGASFSLFVPSTTVSTTTGKFSMSTYHEHSHSNDILFDCFSNYRTCHLVNIFRWIVAYIHGIQST